MSVTLSNNIPSVGVWIILVFFLLLYIILPQVSNKYEVWFGGYSIGMFSVYILVKASMSRCALWTGVRGRSRPQRQRSHGDGNASLWSVRLTWYWCEFTENKIVPVKFARQQNRGTRLARCRGQTVRAGSYTYTYSLTENYDSSYYIGFILLSL